MSRYEPPPLPGEPVPFKTAKQRRELVGAHVHFTENGWLSPRSGVVQESSGKNLMIGGDWVWVDSIARMSRTPA